MDKLIMLLKTSTVHLQGYKTRLFWGEGAINPEKWIVFRHKGKAYDYVGDDLDEALRVFNELERVAFGGLDGTME